MPKKKHKIKKPSIHHRVWNRMWIKGEKNLSWCKDKGKPFIWPPKRKQSKVEK